MTSVQSTLTTRRPCSATLATTRREQLHRVGVAPALVGVGEVLADVSEAGGAEQRVDHRVGEHVRVGVAVETLLVTRSRRRRSPAGARRPGDGSRSRCRRACSSRDRLARTDRLAGCARAARTRTARRRRATRAARAPARSRRRRPRDGGRRWTARSVRPPAGTSPGTRARDTARRRACADRRWRPRRRLPDSAMPSTASS